MDQLLTVIIQTSPIPSHPSTALLEALFRSFQRVEGLLESRIIIVCDGCEEISTNDDNTKIVEVENMKHGKVSSTTAIRYNEHRKTLRNRIRNNKNPFRSSKDGSIELLELSERHGSAKAIEEVILRKKNYIRTPFVMIAQHDNFFVNEKAIPLRSILTMMEKNSWAKMIHFHATATLNYKEKVQRRYKITIEERNAAGGNFTLLPLIFWYGRTSLARTEYYRNFVLKRKIRVGDHLEELLGEVELRDILQNGIDDAHAKYGNFVLNLNNEEEVLYHLSGRRARADPNYQPNNNNDDDENENDTTTSTSETNSSETIETTTRMTTTTDKNNNTIHEKNNEVKNKTLCHINSFTTARSCRAIVPGLKIIEATNTTPRKQKRFKQKCFHCGVKGHSFRFCPERNNQSVEETKIRIV